MHAKALAGLHVPQPDSPVQSIEQNDMVRFTGEGEFQSAGSNQRCALGREFVRVYLSARANNRDRARDARRTCRRNPRGTGEAGIAAGIAECGSRGVRLCPVHDTASTPRCIPCNSIARSTTALPVSSTVAQQ